MTFEEELKTMRFRSICYPRKRVCGVPSDRRSPYEVYAERVRKVTTDETWKR